MIEPGSLTSTFGTHRLVAGDMVHGAYGEGTVACDDKDGEHLGSFAPFSGRILNGETCWPNCASKFPRKERAL